ncbi:hypothetical protein [Mesorhizobium sp. BR1-1-2]|uniref:hypothetical protein n=1 Tax=Mesorhizobium sp. BR1-1-2 TaxID=2876652 RepID=UPI001CCBA28D|nr:hypothetical protein [Mesorhizobium sp. BR1-1-2]MBZ9962683.1 hypothetical protein [Mesorhizobium sp. BR1-1-2]
MSGRRSRRSPSNLLNWGWIILFALGLVAAAVGFTYVYVSARSQLVELDDRLCPVVGAASQTIILIDTTDAIADVTKLNIQTLLRDTASGIQRGGLLEIRALTAAAPYTKELFSLCNPGNGGDLSAFTGNAALARERWQAGFGQPLLVALEKAVEANKADSSPIMAGIQSIAVSHLVAQKARAIPSRLIVVSDMFENTEFFSHYRGATDFDAFKKSPAANRFATDLAGSDVSIWLIRRAKSPVDSVALMAFWQQWIDYNHGVFSSAKSLQGVEG